jgi:KDO2-lipid IV(A) lauroyltransferase
LEAHQPSVNQVSRDSTRDETQNRRLAALIAKIPKTYILGLGRILGRLLYLLDAPHRRIVRRNLYFVHPEWSIAQVRRFSKRTFQHFGINLLEMLQIYFSCDEDMRNKFRVQGGEHLVQALKKNRGVIIISAHLGNYEVALQYPVCYLQQPLVGVAKKMRNTRQNRWMHDLRTRFGNVIIYKKGALPEMTKTLREGRLLGIIIDQSRQFLGVDVDFFGKSATATPAAALLAIRCKSPVVPVFCHRDADGVLAINVQPPLMISRTKDLREDLRINTQRMTDEVEKAIKKYPDQWLWLQKRWKKHYPDLYPGYRRRLERRKKRKRQKSRWELS